MGHGQAEKEAFQGRQEHMQTLARGKHMVLQEDILGQKNRSCCPSWLVSVSTWSDLQPRSSLTTNPLQPSLKKGKPFIVSESNYVKWDSVREGHSWMHNSSFQHNLLGLWVQKALALFMAVQLWTDERLIRCENKMHLGLYWYISTYYQLQYILTSWNAGGETMPLHTQTHIHTSLNH